MGRHQLAAEVKQRVKDQILSLVVPQLMAEVQIPEVGHYVEVEHHLVLVGPSAVGGDRDWEVVAAGNYVEYVMDRFGKAVVQIGPEAETEVSEVVTCGRYDEGNSDVEFAAVAEGGRTGWCCVMEDGEERWIAEAAC